MVMPAGTNTPTSPPPGTAYTNIVIKYSVIKYKSHINHNIDKLQQKTGNIRNNVCMCVY